MLFLGLQANFLSLLQALLEEFGKWIKPGTSADQAERDQFYRAIYQQVLSVSILSLLCPWTWLLLTCHILTL